MRSVLCSILNSVFFEFLSHLLHLSSLPTNHFFSILGLGSVKCICRLCHRILDTILQTHWPSCCWLVSQFHSQAINELNLERDSVESRIDLRYFYMKLDPNLFGCRLLNLYMDRCHDITCKSRQCGKEYPLLCLLCCVRE